MKYREWKVNNFTALLWLIGFEVAGIATTFINYERLGNLENRIALMILFMLGGLQPAVFVFFFGDKIENE